MTHIWHDVTHITTCNQPAATTHMNRTPRTHQQHDADETPTSHLSVKITLVIFTKLYSYLYIYSTPGLYIYLYIVPLIYIYLYIRIPIIIYIYTYILIYIVPYIHIYNYIYVSRIYILLYIRIHIYNYIYVSRIYILLYIRIHIYILYRAPCPQNTTKDI